MIIKKFLGKTEEEAVEAAKKELGSGVVIMNVKIVKRKGVMALFQPKMTEVTVALEEENDAKRPLRREGITASAGNPAAARILLQGERPIAGGESTQKEESLLACKRPFKKVITTSSSQAGYYPGGEMMTVKTLFDPESGVILGAQIVGGKGVDKRIDYLANAVRFGLTGYDLQEMELAYAPPFSSAKDPVNMAGYVIGNVMEGLMKPFYVEDLDQIPQEAICLDVRTDEEVAGGMIPGFIHIPLDSLRDRMNELDLKKEIYITCQIVLRGYLAQRILEQAGAKTWNLSGGYRFYEMMKKDKASMAAVAGMCTACGMEVEK